MKGLFLSAALLMAAAPAWPRAGGGGGGGGGCFPAGTPILTPAGDVPIERVRPGDTVLAFSNDRFVKIEVLKFIKKTDRLVKIATSRGSLVATAEHPLLTRYGFAEVRNLEKGGAVAVLQEGERVWARIKSIKPAGVAEVYNLEVAPPHTFIAGGFIVHNKGGGFGGGGHYYGGRYHSRKTTLFDYIFYGLMLVVLAFKWAGQNLYGGSRSGGGKLPQSAVAAKAGETAALMESLAPSAPEFAPEPLRGVVRDIFFKVQDAWQKRDYSGLEDIMLPYLRAGHSSKVENMRRRGEINMMEDVSVTRIDFVHVSCPAEKEGRAFTALITASARDYTIDESTGSLISGSRLSSDFQEFWIFHQLNDRWALARIDQVGETDYLGAPNRTEGLADRPASVRTAGAAAVAALGDPGAFPMPMGHPGDVPLASPPMRPPVLPAEGPGSGFRPHRQDPLPAASARNVTAASRWDRQKMEIAATLAFESIYTAWGANDPGGLSADFVSAEALAKLRRLMDARKAEGITFGLDSFYTRRAEVVLTSPAEKNPLRLDEFTARITATAQRSMRRNGRELHHDSSPEPFTEYWVFGRQNESWKMRDILPRMDQSGEDRTKDGAPNPSQIEWYWEAA